MLWNVGFIVGFIIIQICRGQQVIAIEKIFHYSGGWDRRILSSRPAWGTYQDPVQKEGRKERREGGREGELVCSHSSQEEGTNPHHREKYQVSQKVKWGWGNHGHEPLSWLLQEGTGETGWADLGLATLYDFSEISGIGAVPNCLVLGLGIARAGSWWPWVKTQ
jgi:hypothetical protein